MAWKPDLEARFTKLQEAVSLLQAAPPTSAAVISGGLAALDLPDPVARDEIHGPDGHGVLQNPRSGLLGGNSSLTATPANGMVDFRTPLSQRTHCSSSTSGVAAGQIIAGMGQMPPSLNFPQFSGENPKIWKTMCEQYFSMYEIHESYFVPMSTLHFSGATAIWLQSV